MPRGDASGKAALQDDRKSLHVWYFLVAAKQTNTGGLEQEKGRLSIGSRVSLVAFCPFLLPPADCSMS